MSYHKKIHTELHTAFLRHSHCILASLKLHSINGIERLPFFFFFYNIQFTMAPLLYWLLLLVIQTGQEKLVTDEKTACQ